MVQAKTVKVPHILTFSWFLELEDEDFVSNKIEYFVFQPSFKGLQNVVARICMECAAGSRLYNKPNGSERADFGT